MDSGVKSELSESERGIRGGRGGVVAVRPEARRGRSSEREMCVVDVLVESEG